MTPNNDNSASFSDKYVQIDELNKFEDPVFPYFYYR